MILEIFRVSLGLLILFMPGYFLCPLFTRARGAKRVYLGFGISLVFIVILGFFLTFMGKLLDIRGFTLLNILLAVMIVSVLGFVMGSR